MYEQSFKVLVSFGKKPKYAYYETIWTAHNFNVWFSWESTGTWSLALHMLNFVYNPSIKPQNPFNISVKIKTAEQNMGLDDNLSKGIPQYYSRIWNGIKSSRNHEAESSSDQSI